MTRCYAWPLTVRAGEDLRLHVSTEHSRFGIRLFRVGATVEEVPAPEQVHDGLDLPIGRPDEAWGWPAYSVPLAETLPDGIYLTVPVPLAADGRAEPVPAGPEVATRRDACLFVLRRDPDAASRQILYKLPTATYAAYNQLGGASTYAAAFWSRDWAAQGYVASPQRPGNGGVGQRVMEGDAPDPYARSSRRQTFAHWDAPFVAWLEDRGFSVSYWTDFDLHFEETLLDTQALVVSGGHDEYWSAQMRQRMLEFVDRGGSMCFFAGDVACFEVEFSAAGDRLFCPKIAGGTADGGSGSGRIGALWHVKDPQDWLTMSSGAFGGGWWDGLRAIEAYQPVIPDHWIFDGVDVPAEGISGGPDTPVIGYETDGVRLERPSDPPRLSEQRRGGGGRVLLALARLSEGWVAGYDQANAAIMIRTAQSGGMVFSVGTTDWPLALGSDQVVSRITENVIGRLVCRALKIHGPVCGEGEYIGEGEMVGAGQRAGWYIDGDQLATERLSELRWSVTGGRREDGSSPAHVETTSGDDDHWLTVTATAVDAAGRRYFGSRTVRVAGTEEYLRRRVIRMLDAMAYPDEQGGALVDQHESEATLAERVIPVRLGWIQQHAAILAEVLGELEARWTASGRMAQASLRPDEK
jgi:hypothetical protein